MSSCGGSNRHHRESEKARKRELGIFFFRFRQSTPSSGSAAAAVPERAPEAGAPQDSTEILEELHKFWQPRWLHHRDVPADQWDRILGFVQAHVPQLETQVPAITVSAWDKVNARYNEHAARGPDGFDKQDLLRMPIVLKERMVQLLNHIEDTAEWPQQLLQGFGIPVSKETAADTINKFRPIIPLFTEAGQASVPRSSSTSLGSLLDQTP